LEEETLYFEWVPAGKLIKTIIIAVNILILITPILVLIIEPVDLWPVLIVDSFMFLFISLLYLNYRGISIKLTQELLSVRYGQFNYKRIHLQDILSIESTTTPFTKYGGMGVRLGLDGSWAYNIDFNGALKISVLNRRPFVFSTRNPDKIIEIINQLKT
jgi:hypothetical protein